MFTDKAEGTFEVKLTPAAAPAQAPELGHMSVVKRFAGDLDGESRGEMLSHMNQAQGSGAYVALERFSGALKGEPGSFLMYHTGVMRRGEPALAVHIVPDSGTGALAGIDGRMEILIEAGAHSYRLHYSLARPV